MGGLRWRRDRAVSELREPELDAVGPKGFVGCREGRRGLSVRFPDPVHRVAGAKRRFDLGPAGEEVWERVSRSGE